MESACSKESLWQCRVVEMPLEQWHRVADACSVGRLVESKPEAPASVPRVVVGGRLALVNAVLWGDLDRSRVQGHLLEPESTYRGPTTGVYHDEDAINAGLKERGCHRGLIVTVNGARMVCSERFQARPTAPSVRLDLESAVLEDRKKRVSGWRQLRAERPWPRAWYLHDGHPVVEYMVQGEAHRVLFYCTDEQIEERPVPSSWRLAPVSVDEEAILRSDRRMMQASPMLSAQAALF